VKVPAKAQVLRIPYDSIKNISGPEDRDNGRSVYAGQMPKANSGALRPKFTRQLRKLCESARISFPS
jgi:hypothetical protein